MKPLKTARDSMKIENKNEYKIAEKFISGNGEGPKAGLPAVFIRFHGCNLNCLWCDTKWASAVGGKTEIMTEDEIYGYIKDSGIKNVTLTGGEPLVNQGIVSLIERIAVDGEFPCEIETNGSVDISAISRIGGRVSVTLDYKLPGSGMEAFMLASNFKYLRENDAVKFVASDWNDLERASEIIKEHDIISRCEVYVSPVFGAMSLEEIVRFLLYKKLNGVRLQPQIHKYIWVPDTKGV